MNLQQLSLPLGLIILAIGGIIGFVVGILRARIARNALEVELAVVSERVAAKDREIADRDAESATKERELLSVDAELQKLRAIRVHLETSIESERKASQEKLEEVTKAQSALVNQFRALSSEALKSNNQSFIELATQTLGKFQEGAKGDLEKRQQAIDHLVAPVKQSLEQLSQRMQEVETSRVGAYEGLSQQVKGLLQMQETLRSETSNLVKALRAPQVRGRWGEIQLRRVVELAGMLDHCDFQEQQSVTTEDGSRLRPDLIVRLPGGKNVVVDAKVPLAGYLDAIEATDDTVRETRLNDHARHIRDHIADLSRKSYWEQFEPAPEFVILFIPGETFFSAALQKDPALLEQGVEKGVIVATPSTLIALLKAVSYGWRQERMAESALKVAELGKEIYKRLGDLSSHFTDVGSRLGKAVEAYNRAIGTLETRVLVSARKFHALDLAGGVEEIESPPQIEQGIRALQISEREALPEPKETKIS